MNEIMIAIPAYGGIKTACVTSVFGLGLQLTKVGITPVLATMTTADVVTARNTLASALLGHTASHLLFIDADIEFRPDTVASLINAHTDVVGCVYPRRNPSGGFVVWHDISTELSVENGAAAVDGIGMGLCLISKDALRRILAAGDVRRMSSQRHDIYGFFDPIRDGDRLLSEDLSFCKRWRDAGGRVMALVAEELGHIGEFTYRGCYLDHISGPAFSDRTGTRTR